MGCVGLMGFALIFCCGYCCRWWLLLILWLIFCCGICGFDGDADGGGGDGFTVVEVAMVWVGFGWFGLDLMVSGWLSVVEFWWKLLCGFARERQKERKERWKSRERN